MKKAVITGANGFIGRELVKELTSQGVYTYCIVRQGAQHIDELRQTNSTAVIFCNMDEYDTLSRQIQDREIEAFYHLAWCGSTGLDRGEYTIQLENVRCTLDAVHAAYALGAERFVGIGTVAEYDVNEYVPLDNSIPNRVSIYGAAKIAAHYMSKAECTHLGLAHLWTRLPNTYGVGNGINNFINFAIKAMLSGQPANFTAGEQMYDFVHVKDVAQGLYRIGEYGKANCSYYIGSTKPAKLKEFILHIQREIGPKAEVNLGAIAFHGVSHPASVYDCTKLVDDTGYCPCISFEEGIRETINSFIPPPPPPPGEHILDKEMHSM